MSTFKMTLTQWYRCLKLRTEVRKCMQVIRKEYPYRGQLGLFPWVAMFFPRSYGQKPDKERS